MHVSTVAAAAAGALSLAGAAYAQDTYVSVSGGAVFLNNSDNEGVFDGAFVTGPGTTIPAGTALPVDAPVGWTTEFDTGYAVQGAIGRRYGLFPAEVEVAYQNNNVSTHNNVLAGGIALANEDAGVLVTGAPGNLGVTVADLVADGQGDVSTIFVMANLFYDLETGTPFKPYIGAGAGVGFVDVQYTPSATTIIDDNSTQFAYQAMAGVAYEVSPTTELFAGYRYRATLNPEVDASLFAATFDVENRASIVEAGVRFSF
ncbi:MAG: outer membrane protein [Hyphococcus sp.]